MLQLEIFQDVGRFVNALPLSSSRIGSFSSGLKRGVMVVLSQGTSVTSSKEMAFSANAMRTLRAYGLGVALINRYISLLLNPSPCAIAPAYTDLVRDARYAIGR